MADRQIGPVGEIWASVNVALRVGIRGLPGGSSLAQLLARHRDVRNRKGLPPISVQQILAWADAHHERTGAWPNVKTGAIADAPGETWLAVEMALNHGQRGMPGGSSLAKLLSEERSVGKYHVRQPLSVLTILQWADAHFERTGRWPVVSIEPISESNGDTWAGVDSALRKGTRGLPGGASLARLLTKERAVPNRLALPRLSRRQILAWADAHHRTTGSWPTAASGNVIDVPGENWAAINASLIKGQRGLRPGGSLAQLLSDQRARPNLQGLPPLSKKKIVAWADEHFERTGSWPNRNSGQVNAAPGERWDRIDTALRKGHRGLAGNSSLIRLLVVKRGVRNPLDLPPLSLSQILQWADAYQKRTGRWATARAGSVEEAPGDTWSTLNDALFRGKRGLPGGVTLAALLADQRCKT